MSDRNLSPQKMFFQLALENTPEYAFTGVTPEEFAAWKAAALPRVLATLGDYPATVPLNPEMVVEWEEDGLVKQRWLIDVSPYMSAAFQVNFLPEVRGSGKQHPALMCWHGHGAFGKDSVMGNRSSKERNAEIDLYNYDYGHQMAQAGFVTYAIDWMGVGERNDNRRPHNFNHNGGRDWCNLYYLHATMLGMTSLSINVAHGKAATDFACTMPFVDPNKLGVMGLSGGGTMTTWSTLCDERLKASEIICYTDLWAYFGIRDLNYCGMQVAPGLFKLVDLPDLQGLIAPRPLLLDIGRYDTCFLVDTAIQSYQQVEKIYQTAGAADRLQLDFFPGEHAWGANKSVDFFKKHLK
ncbi:MAG: alpha/beta hydrolase family protein [Armatimonadota bacterium]